MNGSGPTTNTSRRVRDYMIAQTQCAPGSSNSPPLPMPRLNLYQLAREKITLEIPATELLADAAKDSKEAKGQRAPDATLSPMPSRPLSHA